MNTANAKSSIKTSKEVKQRKNIKVENVRVVGGPLKVNEINKEYTIEMNPESVLDFSTPMMDLSKSVGRFTKEVDKNGKIIKRVDDEKGVEYVLDNNNKIKTRRAKTQEK